MIYLSWNQNSQNSPVSDFSFKDPIVFIGSTIFSSNDPLITWGSTFSSSNNPSGIWGSTFSSSKALDTWWATSLQKKEDFVKLCFKQCHKQNNVKLKMQSGPWESDCLGSLRVFCIQTANNTSELLPHEVSSNTVDNEANKYHVVKRVWRSPKSFFFTTLFYFHLVSQAPTRTSKPSSLGLNVSPSTNCHSGVS